MLSGNFDGCLPVSTKLFKSSGLQAVIDESNRYWNKYRRVTTLFTYLKINHSIRGVAFKFSWDSLVRMIFFIISVYCYEGDRS